VSKKEKEKIEIRLVLKPEEDAYHYFLKIKKKLGVKKYAEVVRRLIKYYYDEVFGSSPQASGGKPSPE